MEEAARRKIRSLFKRPRLGSQSGQAMVEFIIIFALAITMTRLLFFHQKYGIKGIIDTGVLKAGVLLERDLKAGVKSGTAAKNSTDVFMGVSNWNN